MTLSIERVRSAAEASGLAWRGAFHPAPEDLPAGLSAGTIVMLGMTGSEWPAFVGSPEYQDGRPHPLDRWSLRIVRTLGEQCEAAPLFPFLAPPMPFIRWAQKAEAVYPSEIGMLIHPDFGLWHAWRGALAFAEKLDLPPRDNRPRPCDSCMEKPCLSACPVGAMQGGGRYDLGRCGAHIRTEQGSTCMSGGCLARRVCPVGAPHQYTPEQAAFHMKSFRGG